MKIRESGMPDEDVWKDFFEPDKILKKLGLDNKVVDAADFGCGYGTFTIPAAKAIDGKVYAIDIEPEMITVAKKNNPGNINPCFLVGDVTDLHLPPIHVDEP